MAPRLQPRPKGRPPFHLLLITLLFLFSSLIPSTRAKKGNCDTLLSFLRNLLQSTVPPPASLATPCSQCNCSDSYNVTYLWLPSLGLKGTIPNLSNLTFLTHLDLSNNFLSGHLPDGLSLLSNLQYLDLSGNSLSGVLPDGLSRLRRLQHLDLSGNSLSGALPIELSQLRNLQHLDLSRNALEGEIPQNYLSGSCSKLELLNLDHNKLRGAILLDLKQCQKLRNFSIGNNNLSGSIPGDLLGIKSLELLDLSSNGFNSWTPRKDSGRCDPQNMKRLYLGGNRLVDWGFLDSPAICGKLQDLNLSGNGFSGQLPRSVGNFSLVRLALRGNTLTGDVHEDVIPKLTGLRVLDLGNTSLSANISTSLRGLVNLAELSLDHNSLGGELGGIVSSLSNLRVLDASHNLFFGPIPLEKFDSSKKIVLLNLSWNRFGGSIPSVVGDFVNLTNLDVSHNNLSGGIPFSLQHCRQLEYLRLQNNGLDGSIPDFFRNLTHLKLLDLSYNNFTGLIPTGGIFDDVSRFLIDGNDGLRHGGNEEPRHGVNEEPCMTSAPQGQGSHLPNVALAFIIVVAIIFFLLLSFWLLCKYNFFRKENSGGRLEGVSLLKASLNETYADLEMATDGFSSTNLLGSGGIGSVYRGYMGHARRLVAIKVLNKEADGDVKSFVEECNDIIGIKHPNLVKIVAYSVNANTTDRAIVYEFMPNGSLEMWLHEEVVSQPISFDKWSLSLYQRLNIAIDVASALVQLHCKHQKPIVHCNLKPSNVLIDEGLTARITDFAMHRFFHVHEIIKKSSGYIAPECTMGSPISSSWDVYSFGVLLLEIFTGKRPTSGDFSDSLTLHDYVLRSYRLDIDNVIDPMLLSEETDGKLSERSRECIRSIIYIALVCSKESPEDRMEIGEALQKLERTKLVFLQVGGNSVMAQANFDHADSSHPILS